MRSPLVPGQSMTGWHPRSSRQYVFRHRALVLLMLLCPVTATADGHEPGADNTGESRDWTVMLGAGAVYTPDYSGSDDFEWRPAPLLFAEYRDLFYLHGPTAGVNLIRLPHFKLSAAARYQAYGERDASDNDALTGLDDIDAGVDAGLSARFEQGPWAAELAAYQDISDTHDGTLIEFEIDRKMKISPRVTAQWVVSATWADSDYMTTYFGITTDQAAASGLRPHDAGSGLKTVGMSLGLNYVITRHWVLSTRLDVERLVGDAKDSPLVEDHGSATQPRAALFISYHF